MSSNSTSRSWALAQSEGRPSGTGNIRAKRSATPRSPTTVSRPSSSESVTASRPKATARSVPHICLEDGRGLLGAGADDVDRIVGDRDTEPVAAARSAIVASTAASGSKTVFRARNVALTRNGTRKVADRFGAQRERSGRCGRHASEAGASDAGAQRAWRGPRRARSSPRGKSDCPVDGSWVVRG